MALLTGLRRIGIVRLLKRARSVVDAEVRLRRIGSGIAHRAWRLERRLGLAAGERPGSGVLVTTYFTARPDPQRGLAQAPDSYDYIAPWYESVNRLGLSGIIFHDGLSGDFVRRYTTANVSFVAVSADYAFSTNDHRFFVYRDYLRTSAADAVFFTDVSDVTIAMDPFDFVEPDTLYVGDNGRRRIAANAWLRDLAARSHREEYIAFCRSHSRRRSYNAGVLGGTRGVVLSFVDRMCEQLLAAQCHELNTNMLVFNFVAYERFRGRVTRRLCSNFKRFETWRTDVPFIHK